MKIERVWAMPNSETFSIPVINEFIGDYLSDGVWVDPFARNKRFGTYTNDLNPNTSAQFHLDARDFLRTLIDRGIIADVILFDPPYSPRQIQECYESVGKKAATQDTQNARLYKECRDLFRRMSKQGTRVLSFGWNSCGMGKGWEIERILLVAHGGAHNDTICMSEKYIGEELFDSRQ